MITLFHDFVNIEQGAATCQSKIAVPSSAEHDNGLSPPAKLPLDPLHHASTHPPSRCRGHRSPSQPQSSHHTSARSLVPARGLYGQNGRYDALYRPLGQEVRAIHGAHAAPSRTVGGRRARAVQLPVVREEVAVPDAVVCPRIVSTDLDGFRLLAEWHEVKLKYIFISTGCVGLSMVRVAMSKLGPWFNDYSNMLVRGRPSGS